MIAFPRRVAEPTAAVLDVSQPLLAARRIPFDTRPGVLLAAGPVLPLGGQVLPHAGAGPLQRAVHGVDGVPEELRDVLGRPAEHVPQDQHGPRAWREVLDRDQVGQLDRLPREGDGLRGVRVGRGQLVEQPVRVGLQPQHLAAGRRLRAALGEQIQAGVGGDAVHPRPERRAPLEGVPPPPGTQERLLHGVLGVLERPQHPVAVHVQLPPVPLRQPRERRLVDLAQRRHLHVQMIYLFRYMAAVQELLQQARKGTFGRIYEFRARLPKDLPSYKRFVEELKLYKGGMFFEMAGHIIDMMVTLLGAPKQISPFLAHHHTQPPTSFVDNGVGIFGFDHAWGIIEVPSLEVAPFTRRIEEAARLGFQAIEFWPYEKRDIDAIAQTCQKHKIEIAQFTSGLCAELGLVTPASRRIWKALGIWADERSWSAKAAA